MKNLLEITGLCTVFAAFFYLFRSLQQVSFIDLIMFGMMTLLSVFLLYIISIMNEMEKDKKYRKLFDDRLKP